MSITDIKFDIKRRMSGGNIFSKAREEVSFVDIARAGDRPTRKFQPQDRINESGSHTIIAKDPLNFTREEFAGSNTDSGISILGKFRTANSICILRDTGYVGVVLKG